MANFVKTEDVLKDMCGITDSSQKAAYNAVNSTLVQRNWLIGYRIAEEELQGENRAEYCANVIKKLAKELTAEYGKGYIQVKDSKARAWYEREAFEQTWSVRNLQRNVSSQYYHRMLQTQGQDLYFKV